MPLRSTRAPRRHYLLLSLTPQGLHVLHLRRGLGGWKRAHDERLVLSEHDNDLTATQTPLIQRLQDWQVPHGTCVLWVLAGDVMGVALPPAGGAAGPVLPFLSSEVRTHADGYGDIPKGIQPQRPLLWMHKEWIAEIERFSSACGLQLVELFCRGQLFQPWVTQHPKALRLLIESDGSDHFLHIYAASGKLLRTRVLDDERARDIQNAHALNSLIKIEMLGLSLTPGAPDSQMQLMLPAGLADRDALNAQGTLDVATLPGRSPGDWLWGLWRSALEGIVVRPKHHELVRSLTLGSIALGVVGLLVLAGLAWHNNHLEAQISSDRTVVRRQLPRVEIAQTQRAQALRMADVVQAGTQPSVQGDAFDTMLRGLAGFPPPPATLLYLQATSNLLAFVATGNNLSQQWLKDKPAEGFSPYTDFTVPASLASMEPAIHLQARRQPAADTARTPTAPSAAPKASQP